MAGTTGSTGSGCASAFCAEASAFCAALRDAMLLASFFVVFLLPITGSFRLLPVLAVPALLAAGGPGA